MKEQIEVLLDEHASLIEANDQLPHDYASLREYLLQLELTKEINVLRKMLADMDSFAEAFRERCRVRESDREEAVPFSELPEAPANRLYWAIAEIVFKPQSMRDMLAVLTPSIKTHVQVTYPETLPADINAFERKNYLMYPLVTSINSLNLFSDRPQIDLLKHFILCDKMILDTREISNFTLSLHANLQNILKALHPEMAEKLYTHNASFSMLSTDCYLANSQGMTPFCAINDLIKMLVLGGQRMTGFEFASNSSVMGVARFSEYMSSLPEPLSNSLRELKADNTTLGKIINDDLAEGHCVQTAAAYLSRIVQANQNNPIMHTSPGMSEEALRALHNKYKARISAFNDHLDTEKDYLRVCFMPEQLTREVLQHIQPQNAEELIVLLLNFPPDFYDTLFEKMTLTNSQMIFNGLSEAVHNGFFNKEQRDALYKALVKHYDRYKLYDSFLFFMIESNDLSWVEQTLHALPAEIRQSAVKILFHDSRQLNKTLANSNIIKILLKPFTIDEQRQLIQQTVDDGRSVLYHAVHYSDTFKWLSELYPQDQLLTVIKQIDSDGYTLLHRAALNSTPDSLRFILSLYPSEQQFNVISQTTTDTQNALYFSRYNPETFKFLYSLYPMEQRLSALNQIRNTCKKLSDRLTYSLGVLITMLELLPEAERWNAIKIIYQGKFIHSLQLYGLTQFDDFKKLLSVIPKEHQLDFLNISTPKGLRLIHLAAENASNLQKILSLYPEDQKYDAVKQVTHNNESALHFAAKDPESLNLVLALYPPEEQLDAIKQVTLNGKRVLHHALLYPDSLKIILALYPEDQRFDALSEVITKDKNGNVQSNETPPIHTISNNGKTALHFAAGNLQSLEMILAHYPRSQWKEALSHACNHGDTPFHYAFRCSDSLKFILSLYSQEQWFDLLQKPGYKGLTVLMYAAKNGLNLKNILELYPKNKVLDAVKQVCNNGCTPLHYARHPDDLKLLLEQYPEDQRIAAITQPCNNGNSALDSAYLYGLNTTFDLLLSVYPEEQRAAVAEAISNKARAQHTIEVKQTNETVPVINNDLPKCTPCDPTISRDKLKTVLDSYQSTSFLGFLSSLWFFSCFITPQRSQAMIELSLLLKHSQITREQVTNALAKDSDGIRRVSFFKKNPGVNSNGTGTDRVIDQLSEAFCIPDV